jgi:hypothetical protein
MLYGPDNDSVIKQLTKNKKKLEADVEGGDSWELFL